VVVLVTVVVVVVVVVVSSVGVKWWFWATRSCEIVKRRV
jgi:hypothetical protein